MLEVFYSPHVEMSPGTFVQATLGERVRVRTILGNGGGRQGGGVKKGPAGGGFKFFLQGKGAVFVPCKRGKGTVKLLKQAPKTGTFRGSFLISTENM